MCRFSYGFHVIGGLRDVGILKDATFHGARRIFKRVHGKPFPYGNSRVLKVLDLERLEEWRKKSPVASLNGWLIFVGRNQKIKPKKKRR